MVVVLRLRPLHGRFRLSDFRQLGLGRRLAGTLARTSASATATSTSPAPLSCTWWAASQRSPARIVLGPRIGKFNKAGAPVAIRATTFRWRSRARSSSILGGATEDQEESLGKYGRNLGMAFQIVDDVLDLTATEDVLGKPVASDLREGKVTMAVIHALERCTQEERAQIETVLQRSRLQRRNSCADP